MKKSSIHQSWARAVRKFGRKRKAGEIRHKTIPMGQGERRGTP